MKCTFIIGTNAYAVITDGARSMDVLLQAGRSPQQSLRESAADIYARAEKDMARADVMIRAAAILDTAAQS